MIMAWHVSKWFGDYSSSAVDLWLCVSNFDLKHTASFFCADIQYLCSTYVTDSVTYCRWSST